MAGEHKMYIEDERRDQHRNPNNQSSRHPKPNIDMASASSPESLAERISGACAILVLAPSPGSHDDEACADLLTLTEPADETVLSVTVTQTAEERVREWHSHIDEWPAQMGIISTGEFTRSATATTSSAHHLTEPLEIEAISDPADLTGLGITINTFLSEWADREQQIVVCVHSLTPLLQYVDLQRLFRFLHVLIRRFQTQDAVAHFHLDPNAHDAQTVNILTQLVGAVVELDADGDWRVNQ